MPVYYVTEAEVRGCFTSHTIRAREAEKLPPLSIEQVRGLWNATTPAERVEWEGRALAALTDRQASMWRLKMPDASKQALPKRDDKPE